MAQSSEFTILRTSGLGPWRALRVLLTLGMVFVLFTFVVGDYVAPCADRTAQLLKAQFQGQVTVGKTGAWLKEKQAYGNFAVNVGALSNDGNMKEVRIFEFNNRGHLVSVTEGHTATFGEHDDWLLSGVYMQHLSSNNQSAQKYEIQFWKKVFYPLSCLVMVVLALPFAYFHFRSGSIPIYVFYGVMAGISFVLLNNVFSALGTLQGWQPWFTAALPGMIYSMLSLTAFTWLVLRR